MEARRPLAKPPSAAQAIRLNSDLRGAEGEEAPASGRKKKKVKVGGGMRKTRGMIAEKSKGPKTFRCADVAAAATLPLTPSPPPTHPIYKQCLIGPLLWN